MSQPDTFHCPLCGSRATAEAGHDANRRFLRCEVCRLIFVPPSQHLSEEQEKHRYDQHRNSPHDPGYCRFLERMLTAIQPHLAPGSRGLDFGSGPGPTLSLILEKAGYRMSIYDKFYAPDISVLQKEYDFITTTEVFEHLRRPMETLDKLWSCLRPEGCLGIMTRLLPDKQLVESWYYTNDFTHIVFFSRPTFEWLAERFQARLLIQDPDIILLFKPEGNH